MQLLVNASHPKTAVANNALQHCCSTQSLLFYLISVIVLGFFISGSDELVVGDKCISQDEVRMFFYGLDDDDSESE